MATPEAEEAAAPPVLSDLLLRSLKRTYDMYSAEAVSGAPPTFLPRCVNGWMSGRIARIDGCDARSEPASLGPWFDRPANTPAPDPISIRRFIHTANSCAWR